MPPACLCLRRRELSKGSEGEGRKIRGLDSSVNRNHHQPPSVQSRGWKRPAPYKGLEHSSLFFFFLHHFFVPLPFCFYSPILPFHFPLSPSFSLPFTPHTHS